MLMLAEYRDPLPIPLDVDALCRLLAEHAGLLGPCTPLPVLYEEVLRAWRGLPVQSARLREAEELLARLRDAGGLPLLAALPVDPAVDADVRLLAATLLAQAGAEADVPPWPGPLQADDPCHATIAMVRLPLSSDPWHLELLAGLAAHPPTFAHPEALPPALPLLALLRGLCREDLPQSLFNSAVVSARVLHPGVAAHRPLTRLHRLLDYLGLSALPSVQRAYRQLVAQVWPVAGVENWPAWQWVTVPGGPEIFPRAVGAVAQGECTVMRLHELRYAPLPTAKALAALLAGVDPAVRLLLGWLRPATAKAAPLPAPLAEALPWTLMSNSAAAALAYAAPAWWADWCAEGMPAARRVLTWLQRVPLPRDAGPEAQRYAWLERYLLPAFSGICANLLLAGSARGERLHELLAMAEEGQLPAVRALALAPSPGEPVFALLRRHVREGGRPLQAAARAALEHLARRQGLPGLDELERQHLLAAAWELGPLAGERVRVGWQHDAHRLRLSLHGGKVALDVLGPRGPLAHVPAALRASDAYRAARAAQRETQAQYRLFRQHLERLLLTGAPLTAGEFRYLLANPIFAHLAERLVWRTAAGAAFLWAGPDRWETPAGEPVELDAGRTLALVHPVALSAEGTLGAWQSLAADRRLVQPFKQLFREVYVAEEGEGTHCRRFAGRRLAPGQAYAVLRAAGCAPGNGVARREWPGGLTAHLCWARDAAGRDLFGPHRRAEVMSGEIWFTRAGAVLPLREVDPVAFSEMLRTADLLTTRAAVGEAALSSRETVALRALILREVARSFRLTNIAVPEDGRYGLVLGARATYRVNLSSGTVYLEPEGRQLVVSRHGASWAPAEEQDLTSDLIALVLELADDEEITDPAFLAQLGGHGPSAGTST